MSAPAASLSVIVPTHNRARLVRRAVESAVAEGAEVVVVDDASRDDTPAVMDELARRHDLVTYRRLAENRGPCVARNVGMDLVHGELVLFLDDDDALVPGAADVIRSVAADHPGYDLYLHNCFYPDRRPSIPASSDVADCRYEEWLQGRFFAELKPVMRARLLPDYRFPDTGASGEGLLWGRVIRDRPVLVSAVPIVEYDTTSLHRLTSGAGLLLRAEQNAHIADQWLAEFGADQRGVAPNRWADRVLAAATYHVLCGRGAHARALLRGVPRGLLSGPRLAAVLLASRLPPAAGRALFLARRRELLQTVRDPALRGVLVGRS